MAISEAVLTLSSSLKTHGSSASSDNQTTSSSTHSEKEFSILVFIIKDLTNADDVEDISLIDNATTTAAIVLQQIGRRFSSGKFGETVIMFHCTYQGVRKSIDAYVTLVGGAVLEVQLPFPVHSDQEIIVEFKKGLKRGKVDGGRVRLVIIDHSTSMPSIVIPVQKLIRVCREEEVDQIFIDGAHAIGSLRVDIKEIGR